MLPKSRRPTLFPSHWMHQSLETVIRMRFMNGRRNFEAIGARSE
jgi:hypothetical protein